MARSGYTLPVFAVAAAKAAWLHLQSRSIDRQIEVDLLSQKATIEIQQVTCLDAESALAITLSDPGDNLDLTRNTPIWAKVQAGPRQAEPLILAAGEGLGRTTAGDPAIYRFARQLFETNLLPLIPSDRTLTVTLIFPEGRHLAQRTSNESFGILEGLALLGTSGISQPLSAEEHLAEFQKALQVKVVDHPHLIFCIGSNGMQVAQRMGLPEAAIVQTGNWIGALLAEAGLRGARSVLLLGYQGKLVKLAGGIFNTSSHLADAKLEIIAATVAQVGGHLTDIQAVLANKTADAAHQTLIERELATPVFESLAHRVSQRAVAYVQKYANTALTVGTILFDRKGQVIAQDASAIDLVQQLSRST